MKGIILYKSKYGSTKKYAEWLALETNFDVCDVKKIKTENVEKYDEKALSEIKRHNMSGTLENIPLFYCRGGWDMQSMSFVDRNLCKMLRKAVAKKDPSEYEIWEIALMAAGEEKCDWTDKEYLKPILNEIGQ